MAQQQPRRDDQFQNIPRTDERERDVRKNDESGTRNAADPVAPYAYGNTGSGGATGAAYGGMADYGTTGYNEYTAGTGTGTAPGYDANTGATTGYGSADVGTGGQRGREENTDRGARPRGGDTGRNRNMGRDQK